MNLRLSLAASTRIGTVLPAGGFQVDNASVAGGATFFESILVQTGKAAEDVRLTLGA